MIIRCECGNEFEGTGNQKYCSNECRKKAFDRAVMESRERNKAYQKPKQVVPKKHKSQLNKINAEARELGMSYGQYQAMKYMEARNGRVERFCKTT